jgi:CubicO group peptidase (beta-lactamase class C family)
MRKKCFQRMMALLCLAPVILAGVQPGESVLAARTSPASGEFLAFFDRAIPEQMETFKNPGAVVAVVEGGETSFAKGYGFADVENQAAVDPGTTLFRIGSTSKLFTWVAVMQLVELGKLNLDSDINQYLDFSISATPSQPITLRHLMTHTAGFEDRIFGMQALDPNGMTPLGDWLARNLPARVRAPGETSSYSNYGAALAGYIVERVSGMPFADYLDQRIFQPLGMTHTTIRQPLPAGWDADLSNGYVFDGSGFQALDFEYIIPYPTGGATSTAEDMARFLSALMPGIESDGAQLLTDATKRQMQTRLFAQDPRLNGWTCGMYEMSRNGVRVIGHAGDTRLFHSLAAYLPGQNLGLFMAFNSESAFDVQTLLLKEFLDAFFPGETVELVRPTLPLNDPAEFAGSYRQLNRFSETTLEASLNLLEPIIVEPAADGALLVTSALYGSFRFLPVEPMVFVQEDDPQSLLVFRKEADGRLRAFLKDDPTAVMEKLPWEGDYSLHYGILAASLLLFLSLVFLAIIRWMIQRITKREDSLPRAARILRRVFFLLAVVGILFPVCYVFAIGGIPYGLVDFLNVALALPILFILQTLAAASLLLYAWRRKDLRFSERIFYTLVFVFSIAYIWSLNYWHLIGWRY